MKCLNDFSISMTVMLVLLLGSTTFAGQMGLLVETDFNKYKSDYFSENIDNSTGMSFGVFYEMPFNDNISLYSEVKLTNRKFTVSYSRPYRWDYERVEETASNNSIEIPVLMKLPFPSLSAMKFNLLLGPQFSYTHKSTRSGQYSVEIYDQYESFKYSIGNVRKINVGLTGGAMLELPVGSLNFLLSVRYTNYMSQMFKEVDGTETVVRDDGPFINYLNGDAIDMEAGNFSLSIGLSI